MRRICLALPLVWLAALDMSRVGADEEPVANPACSARIIHEFDIKRDGSEFLIVPVKIAGETFSAAIDTGAMWTIVDTSLRQLVGKELGQIDAETPNGTTPFRYYKGMEIEIGTEPAKVTPEKVICCDLASFRYYSKQDFYVMIGMDVLQRFALHLDLPQGKATIFEEAPQTSCKATHLAYFGQIPCVVGWFGDTSSWFMIDTGKLGGGEGDLSHGAFGRLRQRGLLTVTGRTLSISAGGEAEHRSGRVKSLVLADQLYTEAAFSEAESCRLGLAHLSRFTVTLDFPNNVAYFDLPQPLKAAGPLASLGLLTRWQDGKLVVADAHANGRAAKASIRIGDQIVAVDGIDLTEELPLAPPRPSATQRNVELSIARGRSRYNLNVAPTYLVAKSSKPPATAIASRSTLPTQPVLTARSSARRRRMWRR